MKLVERTTTLLHILQTNNPELSPAEIFHWLNMHEEINRESTPRAGRDQPTDGEERVDQEDEAENSDDDHNTMDDIDM